MGFYMCPLDPKVKNIFIGNEAMLLKKRIPISVRAKSGPRPCSIPNKDWKNISKCEFKYRRNSILLKISNKVDNNIIPTSLSRISPIFKNDNSHFKVNVCGKANRSKIHITLSVKESLCTSDHNARENYSPILVFEISHSDHRIDLEWIKSQQDGTGGKMLVALYNIAKDLRIKNIFFYPDTRLAMQFYYHMDFGNDDYEVDHRKAIDWKVNIR